MSIITASVIITYTKLYLLRNTKSIFWLQPISCFDKCDQHGGMA